MYLERVLLGLRFSVNRRLMVAGTLGFRIRNVVADKGAGPRAVLGDKLSEAPGTGGVSLALPF
jgi:hypothetical protein